MKQHLTNLQQGINLPSRAWSISFHGEHLCLTALHNKWNNLHFKGVKILENYRRETDEDIIEFIDDFLTEHKVKRGEAFLGVPRSEARVQIAEFPLEAQDSLDEVVQYQLGNFFPGDLEGLDFFWQIIGKIDQLKVMILCMPKDVMGLQFSFIRKWNLKLAGITLDTFGLLNGIAKLEADNFERSKIMIFQNRIDGLEMIGVRDGFLMSSHYFPISDELDRDALIRNLEDGFSQSRLEPNEVDQYFWSGVAAPELQSILQGDIGIPFTNLHDAVQTPVPSEALTGFGLATCAVYEQLPFGLNMLPEKLRKHQRQLPLILAAVVLALGLLYYVNGEYKEYATYKEEQSRLQAQISKLDEELAELAKLQKEYEGKSAELIMYQRHRASGIFFKVMFALANQLPDHTYITSFQVKEFTSITIKAESSQPYQVERILKGIKFLTDVKPATAVTAGRAGDDKKQVTFDAEINLKELK